MVRQASSFPTAGRAGALAKSRGPGAGAVKYDILTALLTLASQGPPEQSRLALRLSLVITARYNWQTQSFTVAQRELARLWGVTERTVKREMAALRRLQWIEVHIPAARGRVAAHRIRFDTLLEDTSPHWPAVGPDYAARMSGHAPEEEASNVVPLHVAAQEAREDISAASGPWEAASALLKAQDPALHAAWYGTLSVAEIQPNRLTLLAPSSFKARYIETHHLGPLRAALKRVAPDIRDVLLLPA